MEHRWLVDKALEPFKLDWKPHSRGVGGFQATITFANGWGASILFGGPFYTSNGTYELAVLGPDNHLHYDNPVAKGDVRGHATAEEVAVMLDQIQEFPK